MGNIKEVQIDHKLQTGKRIILKEFLEYTGTKRNQIINLKGSEALEAVKQDGDALRYVERQTPEICLAAVKENTHALCYVKEQTPEICLEAVRQNGLALQFVL